MTLRDEDALVGSLFNKIAKRLVRHCKDVRFCVLPILAAVHVDEVPAVNREGAVRIDCDKEQARV